jgi:hypothetical protein
MGRGGGTREREAWLHQSKFALFPASHIALMLLLLGLGHQACPRTGVHSTPAGQQTCLEALISAAILPAVLRLDYATRRTSYQSCQSYGRTERCPNMPHRDLNRAWEKCTCDSWSHKLSLAQLVPLSGERNSLQPSWIRTKQQCSPSLAKSRALRPLASRLPSCSTSVRNLRWKRTTSASLHAPRPAALPHRTKASCEFHLSALARLNQGSPHCSQCFGALMEYTAFACGHPVRHRGSSGIPNLTPYYSFVAAASSPCEAPMYVLTGFRVRRLIAQRSVPLAPHASGIQIWPSPRYLATTPSASLPPISLATKPSLGRCQSYRGRATPRANADATMTMTRWILRSGRVIGSGAGRGPTAVLPRRFSRLASRLAQHIARTAPSARCNGDRLDPLFCVPLIRQLQMHLPPPVNNLSHSESARRPIQRHCQRDRLANAGQGLARPAEDPVVHGLQVRAASKSAAGRGGASW